MILLLLEFNFVIVYDFVGFCFKLFEDKFDLKPFKIILLF